MAGRFSLPICPVLSLAFAGAAAAAPAAAQAPASPECAAAASRCATDGISTAYARRALATAHAYRPRCSCAGRCHPGRSAVRRQRLCSIVCTRCVRSRDRDRMRGLGYRSCAAGRDIYMSNRAGVTCTIGWRGRAGTEERYRRRTHLPPAGAHEPRAHNAAPPPAHGRSASSTRDRLTFCEY